MKRFRIFFVSFISMFFLTFLFYFGWGWYIQYQGINAVPERAVEPFKIPLYRSNVIFGTNNLKGEQLACVLSENLWKLGIKTNPIHVRNKMDSMGIYDKSGNDIQWKRISYMFPSITFFHKKNFSSHSIQSELEQGKLPLVEVKDGNGNNKWLLVTGANNESFIVSDPSRSDSLMVPLSLYGKIFAYRVLFRTE